MILEKTVALLLAERMSLCEDATSTAATYVMSYLKNYQGKKLARLEADGVQVKRAPKCFEAIHCYGRLETTSEDEEESAGACSAAGTLALAAASRADAPVRPGCCARRR
jgi:hypothetical protein